MKKSKKLLLTIASLVIIMVGVVAIREITDTTNLPKEMVPNIQAYNHTPNNRLDNVFEKNGLTILPFILNNSDETITKEYVVEQFNKAGVSIQEITTKTIVTGTQIKTNNKTYTVLIYGDVNGDGYIDVFDAQDVLMSYVFEGEYKLQGIYELAANVDNDSEEVDVFDAQRILTFYVGLEDKLVTNEPISNSEMDKEAPVITLKGANPQIIKFGTPYTELGATVTDNKDKDVKVVIDASKVNVNKVGSYTVTYNAIDTAGNKAVTKTRTVVVEDYVAKIEVTAPNKTTYHYGENIDLTGATIKEIKASGTQGNIVNVTASMISGYNANQLGEQTITVTYNGFTATFKVTVQDQVTGIKLATKPTKLVYTQGEEIDLTGATIKQVMASGKLSNAITVTASMISGYNTNLIGTQTITITYQGNTVTFEVTVNKKPDDYEIGIEVTAPTNTEVKYGSDIDLTGATYKKIMNSGADVAPVAITKDMISGYDKNILGEQEITVSFITSKGATVTDTFNVTVVDYVTDFIITGFKETYKYNTDLDLTGTTVKKVMAGPTATVEETMTQDMIIGYNKAKLGTQELTIEYAGMTKKKNVTVVNYIIGIEITTNPTKLDYIEGDTIKTTGMVVKAVKADGTKETISSGLTLEDNIVKKGVTTAKVQYTTSDTIDDVETTFEASFDITVLEKLSSIEETIELGNRYAKTDMIIATLKQGNNQRPLTKSEVKYYIEKEGSITTDLEVRTELKGDMIPGTAVEQQNDLVMVAKATKVGEYTITPYVGEYATTTIKGTPIVVEVEHDPEVASIELETITDGELRADTGRMDKTITFKNKYGDIISVEANRIKTMSAGDITIEFLDEGNNVITNTSKIVKYVGISTTVEVEAQRDIQLKVDNGDIKVTIKTGEIARVSTIKTEDTIELYSKKPNTQNKLIIDDAGEIYTLIPIELENNYLEKVGLKANQFIGAAIPQDGELGCVDSLYNPDTDFFPNINAKVFREKEDGTIIEATGTSEVTYLGISAVDVDAIFDLKGKQVIITYGSTNPVTKSVTIEVSFKELTTMEVTTETGNRYTKTDMVLATMKEGLNERPLTKSEIKYHVQTEGAITSSDIVVRTELKNDMIPGTAVEQQNDLVMVANATKVGKYTITPYVGDTYPTATVKGTPVVIEVEHDPEVATIEIDNVEVRADTGSIDKVITFKNKYGDEIEVGANRLTIPEVTGVTVELLDENKDILTNTQSKPVKYLSISTAIETSTTKTVSISVDKGSKNITVTIKDIAKLSKINTDATITLYTAMPATPGKLVRDEGGEIYTLVPVEFLNNYNEKVIVKADQFVGTEAIGDGQLGCIDSLYNPDVDFFANINVKAYREKEDGTIVEAKGNVEVTYIGIAIADVDRMNDFIGEHITITYGKANPIKATIQIANT